MVERDNDMCVLTIVWPAHSLDTCERLLPARRGSTGARVARCWLYAARVRMRMRVRVRVREERYARSLRSGCCVVPSLGYRRPKGSGSGGRELVRAPQLLGTMDCVQNGGVCYAEVVYTVKDR